MKFAVVAALLAAQQFPPSPRFVVPNHPDLRITTRETYSAPHSTIDTSTVYFKGARMRNEQTLEFPENAKPRVSTHTTITQCDDRRRVMLNDEARTYAAIPIDDPTEGIRRARARFLANPPKQQDTTGPLVTVTLDSVDTGERRQIGRYTARHVVMTRKIEAEPGATYQPDTTVEDGWYIDLPPSSCVEWGTTSVALLGGTFFVSGAVVRPGQRPDRVQVNHVGRAPRGYPIERTIRQENNEHTTRISLIEFSEAPLDPSLFTIPAGYRPALPTPYGGYDMTRPDTFVNRIDVYWDTFTRWAESWIRVWR